MFHVSRDLMKRKIGATSVLITEYYPLLRRKGRGLALPYSTHMKGVSTIFQDVALRYKASSKEIMKGPNRDKLLSFNEYVDELNEFRNALADKNGITVHTMDERMLYKIYKDTFSSFFVAGVVCLVDYSLSNPLSSLKFIPDEGRAIFLGFSSYTKCVQRLFPRLSIDYRTAKEMYDNYVETIGRPRLEAEEIPLLLKAGSVNQMTALIDRVTSKISPDDIAAVLKGVKSDSILNEYYKFMTVKFNCRESLSKKLLNYKSGIVDNYVEKKHAAYSISLDRTTYLMSEVEYEEEIVGARIFY